VREGLSQALVRSMALPTSGVDRTRFLRGKGEREGDVVRRIGSDLSSTRERFTWVHFIGGKKRARLRLGNVTSATRKEKEIFGAQDRTVNPQSTESATFNFATERKEERKQLDNLRFSHVLITKLLARSRGELKKARPSWACGFTCVGRERRTLWATIRNA